MRKNIVKIIGIILAIIANSCADSPTSINKEAESSVDTLVGNRIVRRIQKEGYFDRIYSKMATDTSNYPIELIKKEPSDFVKFEKFKSQEGITVDVDGASVTIPKACLVKRDGSDYNGMVDIAVVYLSPSKNITPLMPGADLIALAANGDTTPLISYGMINVEMTDETGGKLQLKNGSEATLKYPVPTGFSRPDTIPLWYFNEDNGLWIEDGYSVRNGDEYVGTVRHFTWWNCDIKLDNGARIRVQLKNYPSSIASIYAEPDSIIAWVNDEVIQSNIFSKRSYSIAGIQMRPLKPKEYLDTCIVFNKIVLKDIEGNKLPFVKFKINNVLYRADENGEFSVPLDREQQTAIRFQKYETETITKENFNDDGVCTVVCKQIKEKGIKQNNRVATNSAVEENVESVDKETSKNDLSEAENSTDNNDTGEWDDKDVFDNSRRGNFEIIRPTNLNKNIKYPVECQEKGIEGKVYVGFYIETDGSVTNVKVDRSTQKKGDKNIEKNKDKEFELLEQEAVRCMKLEKFPKRSSRTRVTFPVYFSLSK